MRQIIDGAKLITNGIVETGSPTIESTDKITSRKPSYRDEKGDAE